MVTQEDPKQRCRGPPIQHRNSRPDGEHLALAWHGGGTGVRAPRGGGGRARPPRRRLAPVGHRVHLTSSFWAARWSAAAPSTACLSRLCTAKSSSLSSLSSPCSGCSSTPLSHMARTKTSWLRTVTRGQCGSEVNSRLCWESFATSYSLYGDLYDWF